MFDPFSQRLKRYKFKFSVKEDVPIEVTEMQAAVFKKLIDDIYEWDPEYDPVPKELKQKFEDTYINMNTVREAVR